MMPDPGAVTASDWLEIGKWMTRLWLYFFFIVGFALTFLTAHAVIPSLVSTGQIPSEKAQKLSPPLYIGAALILAVAMVFLSLTVNKSYLLEQFYDRFWI